VHVSDEMIMDTLLMSLEVDFPLKALIALDACKWLKARKMFSLMCNPVFIFNFKKRENENL
jgi:hypothetical protein